MSHVDLESSVTDWLIEHPQLYGVFKDLGIDYSCGGKSLRAACRERGRNCNHMWSLCELRLNAAHHASDDSSLTRDATLPTRRPT